MDSQNKIPSPREIAEQKFASSRYNLLLVIALTALNLILYLTNSDSMLLFSATIPYVSFGIGSEMLASGLGSVGDTLGVVLICIAIGVLALYFVCWLLSKKHYGWMITALVIFSLDTLFLVAMYLVAGDSSGIVDFAIHIWVLYYLISGVRNGHKLKTLPEELPPLQEDIETDVSEETEQTETESDTMYIRTADTSVKSRILLEAEALGHKICYRRVKRVNELVIDGYVYDDVEMLLESAHELNARIDGHAIQVGFDGVAHSYLKIDGEETAKKLRLC